MNDRSHPKQWLRNFGLAVLRVRWGAES